MSHYMVSCGADHAFETCPHFQRERQHRHEKDSPWLLKPVLQCNEGSDPAYEWEPDYDHDPVKGTPFGLCGWCWAVYRARLAKKGLRHA